MRFVRVFVRHFNWGVSYFFIRFFYYKWGIQLNGNISVFIGAQVYSSEGRVTMPTIECYVGNVRLLIDCFRGQYFRVAYVRVYCDKGQSAYQGKASVRSPITRHKGHIAMTGVLEEGVLFHRHGTFRRRSYELLHATYLQPCEGLHSFCVISDSTFSLTIRRRGVLRV